MLKPRLIATVWLAALLQACASTPVPHTPDLPGMTFYSSELRDHANQVTSTAAVMRDLSGADVIVIGELHGHQGSHLLQARLQAALYQRNPDQILALEAFNLDNQAPLDLYLAGELGEEEMMADATAWQNYQASYRPLVEFARRHELPVIAANAPAGLVRCVGRQGAGYLETLPGDEREQLPAHPFPQVSGYRERFMDTMGQSSHGTPSEKAQQRLENTYQAQLLRDSTMADRILRALEHYPNHQLLMITGTFHSEERQGLVAILEQRAPTLDIRVLTPYQASEDEAAQPPPTIAPGDYRYDLWPLPVRYRSDERQRAAMAQQFGKAREQSCE